MRCGVRRRSRDDGGVSSRRPFIDLNADIGEGAAADAELLSIVTSANVACGGHAGDGETMRVTLERAARRGVVIGAHPGYPDRAGFGRVALDLSGAELEAAMVSQLRALSSAAHAAGVGIRYVKPHGALYHRLGVDPALARLGADAFARALPGAAWLAAPGSLLLAEAARHGVTAVTEGFIDRRYRRGADGRPMLVERGEPGALLGPDEALQQAVALATHGRVTAEDGSELLVAARSLCLHGDTAGAADLAARVRSALGDAQVTIRSFAR